MLAIPIALIKVARSISIINLLIQQILNSFLIVKIILARIIIVKHLACRILLIRLII
jgi:hypothetical protein